jgi:hypothetical protein
MPSELILNPHLKVARDIVDASGKKVSYDQRKKREKVEQALSLLQTWSQVWTI